MGVVHISADKLGKAYRYANTLPEKSQRDYGNAYVSWLRNGAEGLAPERGILSRVFAARLRDHIDGMKLWEGL